MFITNIAIDKKKKKKKKNIKKSHWLQVSASKLLRDLSGNINMPNGYFGQNLQKTIQNRKVPSPSNFTYSK